MSLDINHLALLRRAQVWHPTCITEGRRQRSLRGLDFEIFEACGASTPADKAIIACFL